MGLIEKIKKEKEIKMLKNYFWDNVTNDCKERYNKVNTDYNMTVGEFNDHGWYLTDTENMLYKKGTSAYLLRTVNGFDINPLETNMNNLKIEKEFLKVFGVHIQDLSNIIDIRSDFRNGYGWEFQANVNVEEFMKLANQLGYVNNLPLEYSYDEEEINNTK